MSPGRRRGRNELLSQVLPVPGLSFGDPLDRLREAAVSGRVRLRLGDPFDVLAPLARSELLERGARLPVLRERGGKVGRRAELRLWSALPLGNDAFVVQLRGCFDETHELSFWRQIVDRRDAAHLPHRVAGSR